MDCWASVASEDVCGWLNGHGVLALWDLELSCRPQRRKRACGSGQAISRPLASEAIATKMPSVPLLRRPCASGMAQKRARRIRSRAVENTFFRNVGERLEMTEERRMNPQKKSGSALSEASSRVSQGCACALQPEELGWTLTIFEREA